jgi:peptidoglycan hydrolase-like protein with peptidoglycan-binding domain
MIIAGAAGGALVLGGLAWTGVQFLDGNKSDGASSEAVKPPDKVASDARAAMPDDTTPAPAPEQASPQQPQPRVPAASKVPVASNEVVHRAQILLAALGYDPGVVDGVDGAATAAAVRAFQYDEGLTETGTIDDALIAELQSATQRGREQSASATSNVAEQPASYTDTGADYPYEQSQSALAELSSDVDFSGTWYDNNGVPAMIMQSGNAVTVAAMNAATGLPQVIGAGTADGRTVTINYRNFLGVPGTVHAELAPDGMHLIGTDTNAALNIPVPNTWHREHMPGD